MQARFVFVVLSLLLLHSNLVVAQNQRIDFEAARKKMVEDVILGTGIEAPRVVDAMRKTPRHEFVARQFRDKAYFDMSLPIGSGQTISSPYIVAFMTQALDPQPTDKVLEIGTGSGYQAAVLSPLVKEVYTIEIVSELGKQAERTLKRLKYKNVFVKVGDGFQGWTEHAPFDKIIVTCSPEDVPQPLVDQLKEDGLMVIPVGERYQQTLYLMRKKDGKLTSEALQPTLFVPMTGQAEKTRDVQPDPLNPKLINGNFEADLNKLGFVPGWYYQRLMTWEEGDAPEGNHYIRFSNQDLGLAAHLMQAMPLDGASIRELHVSAWIKLDNVQDPGEGNESATIAISFYDKNRRDLGVQTLGRLMGTQGWEHFEHDFRVPLETREALLRVGLFGAVGGASFDDVQVEVKRGK